MGQWFFGGTVSSLSRAQFMVCVLGIYGMTKLEQGFDPVQYLPSQSYVGNWISIKEKYFGSDERALVVIGEIDYEKELWKLSELEKTLEKEEEIIGFIIIIFTITIL